MSIRIKYCIVIVCDSCNEPLEHPDDGGIPHFEDIHEAEKWASYDDDETSWLITPAEHVCPTCRAKQACALVGHDWCEWYEHDTTRGLRVATRYCQRHACPAHEQAPALTTGGEA